MHPNIRIVGKGGKYGLNDALIHMEDDPYVEFFDAEYAGNPKFPSLGQFVSRYYMSTLLAAGHEWGGGLNLDGGVPKWKVTEAQMRHIVAMCNSWIRDRNMGPMMDALCEKARARGV